MTRTKEEWQVAELRDRLGPAVPLDKAGEVTGLTIVDAQWLHDRDGKLVATFPERTESSRAALEPALSSSKSW